MTDTEPYRRKIQQSGGTTYTVSLPKEWADDRGMDVGSRVNLYTRGDRLLVTPPDDNKRQQVTVPAAGHSPAELSRLVTAAYVAGSEEIRITGTLDRETRATVRQSVSDLLGMEITEETDRALVARAMLDADDLSPKQTLAQMETITLSMHEQAVDAVLTADSSAVESVAGQDDSVDRLFALVSREFQCSLVDIRLDRMGDGLTTFDYYHAARQLERVADHAETIGEAAAFIESPPPEDIDAELRTIAADARELVRRALAETLGDRDPDTLGRIMVDAEPVVATAKTLDRELYDRDLANGHALAGVLDSLARTAEYAVNIADTGVQASCREHDTKPAQRPN